MVPRHDDLVRISCAHDRDTSLCQHPRVQGRNVIRVSSEDPWNRRKCRLRAVNECGRLAHARESIACGLDATAA